MTNQDNSPKDVAELRQKAEALARQRAVRMSEDSESLSLEEIRDTLHELRVHQIELEIQNEDLRRAQVEIEAGRARYFELYDLAPVGYCTLSEKGMILEANLTVATLLGVNRSELIKQPISRFILKDDQDIYYLHRKQLFETGEPRECELRIVKPGGTNFWAHLTATAAQAEDGAPVCRAALSDITERKRYESNLKKIAWMQDDESGGVPEPRMPYYGDVTNLNTERTIRDSVGLKMLKAMGADLMRLLDTSVAVYEKNGDYAYGSFVSEWCSLMDGASRKLCLTDDNREALACGRWLCHENCWNESARTAIESGKPTDIACVGGIHLYGMPIFAGDEVVGAINIGYGSPPTDDATLADLAQTFSADIETLRHAASAFKLRPSFIVETAKARLVLVARQIGQMVENRRGQNEIYQAEALLHAAMDKSPVGIAIADAPSGDIRYVNDAGLLIRGGSREDIVNGAGVDQYVASWQLFDHDGSPLPTDEVPLTRAIKYGEDYNREFIIRTAEGDDRTVLARAAAIKDRYGKVEAAIVVFLDITDRIQAEEEKEKLQAQLVQAQKMETVGRLAGGVAHDFNNMLSVILGNTELAMESVAPDDPLYNNLSEISSAANRSADITRQLLAFARKQTIVPKMLDLNRTIKSMLKMLRRLIGEDINLAWRPERAIWPVRMDPSQIDQILANLCINARDAIADTGKITMETGTATFDSAYCAEHPDFVAGDFVLMAVSDDGCGMDQETKANLFEPFFTTKDVDKGTGLGLATVYGIVKQNDGFINVYSEPGQGTTFRIYLPRYLPATESPDKKKPDKITLDGTGTILLVEDEPSILRMTTMMLERIGYTVLAAGTPGEAMDLARENAGEIHLLITDVVMPEMNGRDLAKKLLSLYPDLKGLFMSGYTANVIAHHGVLDEGVHFIQKPFSKGDLSVKVREALLDKISG